MEGWIKLHRQIRENPIYTNSHAIHTWIECLLRASHEPREFYLRRKKVYLQDGQFVMGRSEFGKSIGISGSTVWFWINEFEKAEMLDSKKTAQGTIITILNWKKYQSLDSKKTEDEQQKNTYKKVKKDNKVKKTKEIHKENFADFVKLSEEEHQKLIKKFGAIDTKSAIDILNNYKGSSGKKYKSDYHAILSWVIKEVYKQKLNKEPAGTVEERAAEARRLHELRNNS